MSRGLQVSGIISFEAWPRLDQRADGPNVRDQFVEHFQPLRHQLAIQAGHARKVPSRPVEARDQSTLHWINPNTEYNRDRSGGRLGCLPSCSERNDHRYLSGNEFGGKRWQSLILTVRPPKLDRYVPALHKAFAPQP